MRRYPWRTVIFIVLILSLATLSLVFPRFNLNFLGVQLDRDGMVLGLDLQGGTHLVYEADVEDVTEEQMAGVLDYAPALSTNLNVDDTGNTFAGVLNGRYRVYIDPYSANTGAASQFYVCGYKGTSPYDAGLFYCP